MRMLYVAALVSEVALDLELRFAVVQLVLLFIKSIR